MAYNLNQEQHDNPANTLRSLTRLNQLTTAPVEPGDFSNVCPEWGRTDDVRRVFGIKRGTLYNLHADRKVYGKVLRVRGELKGVRLWDMDSIRRFINSQPDSMDEVDGFDNGERPQQNTPSGETGQTKPDCVNAMVSVRE